MSEPKQIPCGLPQGSPLSVILYILYNSNLLQLSDTTSLKSTSIGYVDEIVHLAAGKNLDDALRRINGIAERFLAWGRKHAAVFDKG